MGAHLQGALYVVGPGAHDDPAPEIRRAVPSLSRKTGGGISGFAPAARPDWIDDQDLGGEKWHESSHA